jgi:5,10-methylenetetrahydrofolate reductase
VKSVFLFVPASKLKAVWNRIGAIHEKYIKHKTRLGYDFVPTQFLYVVNIISALQQEQSIPITVVNMP